MISSTFFSSITRSPLAGFRIRISSADELHQVFVAGDDNHVEIFLGRLARERADNVVRFVSGIFEDGQTHRLAIPAHERESERRGRRASAGAALCRPRKACRETWARQRRKRPPGSRSQILVLQKPPHHAGEEIGDVRRHAAAVLRSASASARRRRERCSPSHRPERAVLAFLAVIRLAFVINLARRSRRVAHPRRANVEYIADFALAHSQRRPETKRYPFQRQVT